jgi:hypothetical protein
VSGLLHAPAALFSRKELPAPTDLEGGSTPAQVWTYWNKYVCYVPLLQFLFRPARSLVTTSTMLSLAILSDQ